MLSHFIHSCFAGLSEETSSEQTIHADKIDLGKKKAKLLCHMQATRDSEELCHLVDCTTLLRLLEIKSLHHLLTDIMSSPCQA